jgi:hypothetical protein
MVQAFITKDVALRRLPIPISLADGHYPSQSDASASGRVYGGCTLLRDPSRWHWQFVFYNLLESGGFTHWLPPDVECLPTKVEP